jgi:hypothetical protein
LAVLGASHIRRSGEDPTSNPTNPGTTSPSHHQAAGGSDRAAHDLTHLETKKELC